MAAKKKQLSFEEQLAHVEKLINEMEAGNLPLEDTLARYEEGIVLLGGLEKELNGVKQRLSILRSQPGGTMWEETTEEVQ